MRIFFFTIFFLFPFYSLFFAQGQKNVIDQIHNLLDSSNYYAGTANLKSLKFAKKANVIAKEEKNVKEIAQTSLFIARSLYALEMYKQSLEYINVGRPLAIKNEDVIMEAQFKELALYSYAELGLSKEVVKQGKEIISLLQDEKNDESKRLISRIYGHLAQDYSYGKKYELATEYINKAIEQFPKTDEEYNELNLLYQMKGYNYLNQGEIDSAYYYFKKNYLEESVYRLCQYQQATALGDYYFTIKNYSRALGYFHKALDIMNNCNLYDTTYSVEIYEKIYKIYGLLGNKKMEEKYLKEYYKENLKLKEINIENIPAAVDSILNGIEEKEKSKNTILITSASGICLLIILFSYWRYCRLRKKKKKIIHEKENSNQYLTKENQYLTREVEDKKFLELIDLAKNNNPEFLVLFEELYPNLILKLKKVNPKIRNSELAFCALAYLNFSTKDIAEYTFVSIATVHSRKNRFRKKYNIPSDEDFNVWMRELGNN